LLHQTGVQLDQKYHPASRSVAHEVRDNRLETLAVRFQNLILDINNVTRKND